MWRNTGQPVRLLMLDARACLPILSVMVYWSWPTLYIAIVGVTFFSMISLRGLTLPAMLRLIRYWLVGSVRTAVPVWNRRRFA
ncbi:MAG TPA: IcmT/TraK family protein [Acetobacteraceae bacterium]|jgi:intracellular multiplication protein IcmT|nr:IcmT/TraK family protein [Acetobacteraceae bacterium]